MRKRILKAVLVVLMMAGVIISVFNFVGKDLKAGVIYERGIYCPGIPGCPSIPANCLSVTHLPD